jgi:translation initiation factor IF-3
VNERIRIPQIRVIGAEGEQLGILYTEEALQMAKDHGLDLVEVAPEARPPVCKIMDYGKFKYEQGQKQRKQRAASKATEMKELRLGRSVKIDPHDVQIRIDQARRFLMHGHKVLFTQRFKGREIAHKQIGLENLRDVATALADIAKLEQPPRWFGKSASIILAPDKERADKLAAGEKVEDEKSLEALEAEIAKEIDADAGPDIDEGGPDEE